MHIKVQQCNSSTSHTMQCVKRKYLFMYMYHLYYFYIVLFFIFDTNINIYIYMYFISHIIYNDRILFANHVKPLNNPSPVVAVEP